MKYTYMSLGAGVQSSALLILAEKGEVERPDIAVFADTGDEPSWVYEHLEKLEKWSSIPILRVSHGHLSQDVIDRHNGNRSRFAAIPAFTLGKDGRAAPLRRQCTREYKIDPIKKAVRLQMGYAPRKRVKHDVKCCLGISIDEATRMRPSRDKWCENIYPLVDLHLSRRDCMKICESEGFKPRKSSCVFCPYHSDAFWVNIKRYHHSEFNRAVVFDRAIRDMSMSGVARPVYLHRSLHPLDEVQFKDQVELFDEECSGICGV